MTDASQRTLWIALGGFLLLLTLEASLGMDRLLTSWCYDASASPGWFLGAAPPWHWLYHYGVYPVFMLTGLIGGVALGSLWWPAWRVCRRACLIFILTVLLGPGMLINGLLKPYWGRPRPRQVIDFGGTLPYRHWWQPGGYGHGKSFPSGHASMGYALFAATTLLPQRHIWWRRSSVAVAFAYGTLLGVTRIIQGGHFASDVLWAGSLMVLTSVLLQWALASQPSRFNRQ